MRDNFISKLSYALHATSLLILLNSFLARLGFLYWITLGRVTVGSNVTPISGDLKLDLTVSATLAYISLILLLCRVKNVGLKTVGSLTIIYIMLTILFTLYLHETLFVMATVLLVATIYLFFKGEGRFEYVYGIMYAIAGIELLVLLFHIFKIATGKAVMQLANALKFEATIWSCAWWLSPLVLFTTFLIGVFRARNPNKFRMVLIKYGIGLHNSRSTMCCNGLGKYSPVLLVLLPLIISLLPYLPTVNPDLKPVNTDWIYYYNYLLKARESGLQSVLIERSDRPLYIVLLYCFWRITGVDLKSLAVFHNVFLLPLYTASLFYLAKEYYGLKVAKWIPIVAPMSPIFLSFIYGGFQANLFTLSLLLIALGLLAKPSPRRTAIASAIFAITLFTHSWTWLQYTAVLTLMLLAKIVKAGGKVDRESLKPYLIVFAACIVSFTIRELVFMEKSFTLTATKFTCRNYSGFENLASIIDKLHFFFNIYTGGTLNYPIYYVCFSLGFINAPITLVTWFTLIPLALIPLMNVLAYRVLLNTPIPVFTALFMEKAEFRVKVLVLTYLVAVTLSKLVGIIPTS